MWLKIAYITLTIFGILKRTCFAENEICGLQTLDGKDLEYLNKIKDNIIDTAGKGSVLIQNLFAPNGTISNIEVQVKNATNKNNKYVEGNLKKSTNETERRLEFFLTISDDFATKYEESETETTMLIQVLLTCNNTHLIKPYLFEQKITDTNNHDPILETSYEYQLPMPLPKGMNLFNFGPKIVAKDVDLTNSNITFTLNSITDLKNIFSISWDKIKILKNYTSEFKTADNNNLLNDVEMILIAEDNGNPKRNTTATIKIKIVDSSSLPQFSDNIYMADYRKTKLDGEIKFDKEIILYHGIQNVIFTLNHILPEIKNAFQVVINETTNTISIKVSKWPKNYKESNLFITLQAKKLNYIANTTLYLSLPVTEQVQESSNGGLLAATIILSLLLVGILIGLAYFYNKHR